MFYVGSRTTSPAPNRIPAVPYFTLTATSDHPLAAYHNAVGELREDERMLRRLIADNPRQQKRLTTLEELIQQRLTFSEETLDLHRQRGLAGASALISTGRGREIVKDFGSISRAEPLAS
jgi:CHASE3 domain sensor protein